MSTAETTLSRIFWRVALHTSLIVGISFFTLIRVVEASEPKQPNSHVSTSVKVLNK